MNKPSPHLTNEAKITWLSDPAQHPYLREVCDRFPLRSRFPRRFWRRSKTHALIGYSEISVLAEQIDEGFYRRYWWVKKLQDPWPKWAPAEGVRPSSVRIRKLSVPGRDKISPAA